MLQEKYKTGEPNERKEVDWYWIFWIFWIWTFVFQVDIG